MENNTFIYNYSATQNKEVEEIKNRYLSHEESKLETLRRLDNAVQNAGVLASLCLGIIAALIFGVAMCFALGVFGTAWWPAIPIGIVGIAGMIPAYPLYKYLYNKKKEELAPQILRLAEDLVGE